MSNSDKYWVGPHLVEIEFRIPIGEFDVIPAKESEAAKARLVVGERKDLPIEEGAEKMGHFPGLEAYYQSPGSYFMQGLRKNTLLVFSETEATAEVGFESKEARFMRTIRASLEWLCKAIERERKSYYLPAKLLQVGKKSIVFLSRHEEEVDEIADQLGICSTTKVFIDWEKNCLRAYRNTVGEYQDTFETAIDSCVFVLLHTRVSKQSEPAPITKEHFIEEVDEILISRVVTPRYTKEILKNLRERFDSSLKCFVLGKSDPHRLEKLRGYFERLSED